MINWAFAFGFTTALTIDIVAHELDKCVPVVEGTWGWAITVTLLCGIGAYIEAWENKKKVK